MPLSLRDRAAAYNTTFPQRPPMHANDRWLEGCWIGGNNYKGSGYYGAYPPDYLARVGACFPDMVDAPTLHLFSGSLGATVGGVRVDIKGEPVPGVHPDVQADAERLPFANGVFRFILADTPYSPEHAAHYGTSMPDRRQVLRELARVTQPDGWLVWLDTKLPMFRRADWHWCGAIQVIRSTNHNFRGVALFRRAGINGA